MKVADLPTTIRFEKASAATGARVHGVSVDQQATPEVVQALHQGLHEHGVLFFEFGEVIDEERQRKFARLFGELEPVYGFSTKQQEAQAKAGSGGLIDSAFQPLKQYRTNMWHTDGTP